MTTYVSLGAGGADTWVESVPTVGDLPSQGADGQVRLVRGTGTLYYWNGSAWAVVGAVVSGGIDIEDIISFVDGSTASAGEITETLSTSQASATATGVGATGTFGNVVSVAITAGRWIVTGVAGFDDNGANLTTAVEGGISASATGAGLGIDDVIKDDSITGAATVNKSYPVPNLYVSLGSTTTYYLNTKFTYSSGSPRHFGKIVARRIG